MGNFDASMGYNFFEYVLYHFAYHNGVIQFLQTINM
jgi:hypothetical protein